MNYIKLFGYEWSVDLEDYLKTKQLEKIAIYLNKERESKSILPEKGSKLLFKVFRKLPPKSIKVVILGQDIYSTKGVYDGYAFSCSNSLRPQPSLTNIINEIEYEYPDNFNLKRFDLEYLVNQGVFLVNTSHTVVENAPGTHIHLWKSLTLSWMKALQNYNDIGWLLMGNFAQSFKEYITNKSHFIIETSHPSPLGFKKTNKPFYHSNCFKEINKQLEIRNKRGITW